MQMGRKREGERVFVAKTPERGRWRVIHIHRDGKRVPSFFATEGEAKRFAAALEARIDTEETTIHGLVDGDYFDHLVERGRKRSSIATTVRRLKKLPDIPPQDFTPKRAATWYQRQTKNEDGSDRASDTHLNELNEARSFFTWVRRRGYLARNPLEDVEGKGRRRAGKPQLRIDEARLWMTAARREVAQGRVNAIAALMTLLLGVRASEVAERQVRDLDDGGRLLWVPDSKTDAGRRTLEVPDDLREYLLALAEGRKGGDWLFPGRSAEGRITRHTVYREVKRICGLAGVEEVCAHAMRGLHATLATEANMTGHAVSRALGHASTAVTQRHYTDRTAHAQAQSRRALDRLGGASDTVPQSFRTDSGDSDGSEKS